MHSPTNDAREPTDPGPQPVEAERGDGGTTAGQLTARLAALSPAQKRLLREKLERRRSGHQAAGPDVSGDRLGTGEPVAIVGVGCRLPGADDPNAFWELIESGREAVGPVPAERWDQSRFLDPSGRSPGKMSVDAIGAIRDFDRFDPAFFGIAPREAARMDPQQRLLLEVAWETFEHAGIPAGRLAGSKTGVFIGIGGTDYSKVPARYPNYYEQIDAHVGTGNALSIAAGRISYLFDLHGPAFIVDTACSSALVAIHSAVTSLQRGESDAAIAGGVNLILTPETTIAFSKARMLSVAGHCRPFDAEADGYVRGEGCGLVLLKRLSDAERDRDRILGVIRGTAVNQDGRTSGITAPSGHAQQQVIRAALAAAGLGIDDVAYVEAHGTGTPLGDPIELMALADVFAGRSPDLPPVRIGSVKANIGHTETVSGIAGLLKVLLMFRSRRIPAQANFARLNPNARVKPQQLRVAAEAEAWEPDRRGRLVAGVSSFGFGGTNVHLIVEGPAGPTDAAASTSPGSPRTAARTTVSAASRTRWLPPAVALPLSVRNPSAWDELAERMRRRLDGEDDSGVWNVSATAALHRAALPDRAVILGADAATLCDGLDALAAGSRSPQVVRGSVSPGRRTRVAMVFTGQGSQYVGMGRRLAEHHRPFREALQRCAAILDALLPIPLAELLDGAAVGGRSIDHTSLAQPAIVALQCALVDSLADVGIRADAVAGHSIGEISALYAAGAYDLETALRIAVARGAAMGALPTGGAMAAVFADQQAVEGWIEASGMPLAVAAANGPGNTVIAGAAEPVAEFARLAEKEGFPTRQLNVSHAFHSPLMESAVEPLRRELSEILPENTAGPKVPFFSAVTGRVESEAIGSDYWLEHLVRPVRYSEALSWLTDQKLDLVLEVGPHPQLTGMFRRHLAVAEPARAPATAAPLARDREDFHQWMTAVAQAWCVGAEIDWQRVFAAVPWSRVDLPNYPFQRERYWYDPPTIGTSGGEGRLVHPLLGSRLDLAGGATVFQTALRDKDPAYLADHVVAGSVTVPAAAWIETLRAAAAEVIGERPFELRDVEITRAQFLTADNPVEVQVAVEPFVGSRGKVTVATREDDPEAGWEICCTAVAVRLNEPPETLPELSPPVAGQPLEADPFYEKLAGAGLSYGEHFRTLQSISADGVTVQGTLQLPAELTSARSRYVLHPTLLDGGLQLVAATLGESGADGGTYLPVGLRRLRVVGSGHVRQAIARRRESPGEPSGRSNEIIADLELFDEDDRLVAALQGVRFKSLRRATDREPQDPARWFYRVAWEPLPELEATPDRDKISRSLPAAEIRYFGDPDWRPVDLPPLTRASSTEPGSKNVSGQGDAAERQHWVWIQPSVAADVGDATRQATEDLLRTVRRAIGAEPPPRLSVITCRASSPASDRDGEPDPAGSAAAGLVRVATLEHPELDIRRLDLERYDEPSAEAAGRWLASEASETELALRAGRWWRPRLLPAPRLFSSDDGGTELTLPASGSYRVRLDGTHRIEGVWAERIAATRLQPNEVAIRIRAVGLNFSDVLKAMGLYPGIRDRVVPLGIEVCGEVTAVGEAVRSLDVGARVMGVVPHGFASDDATQEYLLVPVPGFLHDQEAAGIPIVFMTAHHALLRIGRLRAGESVLIHAGAGGVGLAAIQVAQTVGATIYATAGSNTKRRLLASLGVDPARIFDSRDLGSIELIREQTAGRGVDVVLNSLPGEWIDASLSLLAAHGRFLEIGKTDIYQNRPIGLGPFQDNLSYSAIDLDRLLRERHDEVRELLAEIRDRFASGAYQPLPLTTFRMNELPAAMRFMAARRNIGKIVVTPAALPPDRCRRPGTHLITGGSGAIGLGVARRLIARGAREVALLARRPATSEVVELQKWARKQGADVRYFRGDCADTASLRRIVQELTAGGQPIIGIVHAAGLLEDGVLADLSAESLARVMRPKVEGAIALQAATEGQPLEYFTLLGSVAAWFGSPGQANYAAANAFLEGFAEQRRRRGVPASVVHWGPWGAGNAASGMAEDPRRLKHLAARGLRPLDHALAIDLLIDAATDVDARGAVVVDANWGQMLSSAVSVTPSLFRALRRSVEDAVSRSTSARDEALLAELGQCDRETQLQRLVGYFAAQLGQIMGIEADSIDASAPLASLGLDSLMAIELKNTIEARLDLSLPISRFVDEPTLERLAEAAADGLASENPVARDASGSQAVGQETELTESGPASA